MEWKFLKTLTLTTNFDRLVYKWNIGITTLY